MKKFKTFKKYEKMKKYIVESDERYDAIFLLNGHNQYEDYRLGAVFSADGAQLFAKACLTDDDEWVNLFTGYIGMLTLFGYSETAIIETLNESPIVLDNKIRIFEMCDGDVSMPPELYNKVLSHKMAVHVNRIFTPKDIKIVRDVYSRIRKAFEIKSNPTVNAKSEVQIVGHLLEDGVIIAPLKKNNLIAR